MCVRVGSLILQLEEMGRTFLYYFFSVAFLCPCIRFGASMRRRRLTATCSVLPSPRGPEAHTALVGVPPESRPFFFCTSQGSSIYLPDLEPGSPSFVSSPSHHPPSHPTPPPGAWPPPPTTVPRCTASLGAPCTRRWCIPVQMTKSSAPGARASLADPPPQSLRALVWMCVVCCVFMSATQRTTWQMGVHCLQVQCRKLFRKQFECSDYRISLLLWVWVALFLFPC